MSAPIATALVTGATSGLGREIARQLAADRGALVLATGRRADRLAELAGSLPEGRLRYLAGDLADTSFREELWEWSLETAGPGGVDLLVNNAGIGHYDRLADQDLAEIRAIFEINVLALVDLTQKAARHMTARGSGQILQISSILGRFGLPYSAAYVASKHAVDGLVRSLTHELRGTGVRVWAAQVGRTRSEFFDRAHGGGVRPSDVPPGRDPALVARSILRGLDRRSTFVPPTLDAWLAVAAADWFPGLLSWGMGRFGIGRVRAEFSRARLGRDPNPSAP